MPTTFLHPCSINFFYVVFALSTIIFCVKSGVYTRNYFLDVGGHLMHVLPDFECREGRVHVIFIFVA